MRYFSLLVGGCLISYLIAGCASKPCREPEPTPGRGAAASSVTTTTLASSETKASPDKSGHVFVAKLDGSKQCEGKGIPAATMAKELKGIKIFSQNNQTDGMMRIQMCGASTGRYNVYEINAKDFDKAAALGFKDWKSIKP